jgi:sodium/bile acid cotransporter 7
MSKLQGGEDGAGTTAQHVATPPQQDPQTQGATAAATPTNPSKRPEWLDIIITTLQDQWFLVGIGVVILIASQVQVPSEHQKIKETLTTYLSVSIIFFITGCTLDTRVLIQNYSRWKVHLFVQGQCFLMTSAISFGVVSATATNKDFVDPGLLVGLIFFGCVATTMSSNVVMTRQAHGNSALTVVQTTLGNFLGVSAAKCYLTCPRGFLLAALLIDARMSSRRRFAIFVLIQR